MRENSDGRRPWWAGPFLSTGGRFLSVFVYSIAGAMNLLLTFNCWIWWRLDVPLMNGAIWAGVCAFGHLVFVYETGYKKIYLDGRRRFFYLVWLVPCVLSVIGFIGGLFYRGIV